MKGVGVCVAAWVLGGSCLRAQDLDSLWLKPSALPDLTLHSGAMVLTLPAYPGSKAMRSQPFPIFNGEWKGRITFGASRFGVGGGAAYNLFHAEGWKASLGMEGVESRVETMADSLAGMGSRPATLFASAGVAWRTGPLELMAGLRHGFRQEVGGGAVFRASLTLPLGRRWLVEARVAGSAFERDQMNYEYGINAEQADRRHALVLAGDPRLQPGEDRQFQAAGGWALLQSSLAIGYAVSEHWRLGITFLQQEVQGEARHSPLVLRPRSQGTVIGFSYQL
jgi:outer membrane scaffolding protein for murein synthesis (MipA/OmpV family)